MSTDIIASQATALSTQTTALSTIVEFAVILALVLANGFFVAAEFALVKVRASQFIPILKTGGWRVRFAVKATEHLDAVLSATQFGITLASLALGWVGEPFLAKHLKPLLALAGVTDETAVTSVSFTLAFALITFFHIVLGELAPKSLAIQRSEKAALFTAAPLMWFYWLFFPFIWTLNKVANLVLRLGGLQPASEHEKAFSHDELEYVFSHSRKKHPDDALVDRLIVQTVRTRDTTAAQIMIPVDDAVFLDINDGTERNISDARAAGHSRYPVCQGSKDNVLGLLLTREWLWQMQTMGQTWEINSILHNILRFRPNDSVPHLLERLRSERSHMGVVIGDDRKVAGIVTLEDVLEEIVGNIQDELELRDGPVFSHTTDEIVVRPDMLLRDLQNETGWDFEADFDLSKHVGQWLGDNDLTGRGQSRIVGHFRVTVRDTIETPPRRIRRVSFKRLTEEEAKDSEHS